MTDKPELVQLLSRIATLRDRIASARRLADEVTDRAASQGLLDYANELERETAELDAHAAILQQDAPTSPAALEVTAQKSPALDAEAGSDAEPEAES